jgi:(p)ppGpp synthase/HD superfamily hydrolase
VFGETVASIVQGCSDTLAAPKPPWLERKQTYIEHLRTATGSTRLVSAADKLHNSTAILNDYSAVGEKLWERFNPTKEQVLWYYQGLVGAFQAAGDHSELVRELAEVVNQLLDRVKNAPIT